MCQRVLAFEKHYGRPADPRTFVVTDAVPCDNPEQLVAFIAEVNQRAPGAKLIVIDTFNRSFGGDENSAQDMSKAVAALDRLRKDTEATVLFVHHSNKGEQGDYRGSSVLAAAVEVKIKVEAKHGGIVLTNDKQKNARKFGALHFKLEPVTNLTPNGDEADMDDSCVLVPCEGEAEQVSNEVERQVALETLRECGSGTVKTKDWFTAAARRGLKKRTFERCLEELEDRGSVEHVARGKWRLPPIESASAKTPPVTDGGTFPREVSAATATPPVGGGSGNMARVNNDEKEAA